MIGRADRHYLICFLAVQYPRLTLKMADTYVKHWLFHLSAGMFSKVLVVASIFITIIVLQPSYFHVQRYVYPCLKIENDKYTITQVI